MKTYDANKDYMEVMKKAAASGNQKDFYEAQTGRNAKINGEGLSYGKTDYTMEDFANSNGIVPSAAVPNTSGKIYNPGVNYTSVMQNAEQRGNWSDAMDAEKLHNTKDGDLGLGWGVSGKWNYLDPQSYGGRLDAMRDEIKNYKPFEYDYTKDDAYLSMKKLKEKEADKAYADGYAQLSTAFDGDIPVNMINKLMTTKSEITDQADSYIPQLRQMAYDMYNVERNDLYNQYGLLDSAAQQDYNRWSADRDVRMRGIENDIANRRYNQEFDYMRDTDTYNRNYQEKRDLISDARYDKEWDYTVSQDALARQDAVADMAASLWKAGLFSSMDAAYDEAQRLYGRAAGSPPSSGTASVAAQAPQAAAPAASPQGSSGGEGDSGDNGEPSVVQTGALYVDENGELKIRY